MGRAGEGREASPSPACPRTESFENPGHGRASRACAPFLAFTAVAGYGEAPLPRPPHASGGRLETRVGGAGEGRRVRGLRPAAFTAEAGYGEASSPGRHVLPRGVLRTRGGKGIREPSLRTGRQQR